MRNLKRALSLGLTAAMISGLMVMGSSAASYADVTSENNVEAIEVLESVGIMIGDESGNFNPDQNVTRNEMAVVMANLMEYNVASYKDTSPFTDVPSWAEPYVAACWTNGITAGYSDTIYGGSDTVTTAQAALMLMKALGYFQYSSDFGGDWQLATTRQGNAIDLFNGVDSGVTQAMTRNDVAQLVLNTLRAGTVQASTDGSWTIGDVTINNNVQYSYITSNADYAMAIDDTRSTDNNTDAGRSIVELGEQLYQGDLQLNDNTHDVFGRPARYWEYDGSEIGTYAKTELLRQTYTTEVTGRDLYDLLGSSTINEYTFNIAIDGETEKDVLGDAYFDEGNLIRSNTKAVGGTDDGVLTEVYVDVIDKTVDIAVINTYLAKADDDYDDRDDEVTYTVWSVDDVNGDRDNMTLVKDTDQTERMTVSGEDFDIADVVEDDIVLVRVADGEIQEMIDPEVLSAVEIQAFKNGSWVNVEGTQYDYASSIQYDEEVLDQYDDYNMKDTTYNVYLDPYGYAIGVEIVDAEDNYVFVTGMDSSTSNLTNRNLDANVIFLDGTMDTIQVNSVDSENAAGGRLVPNALMNTWCEYTVNSAGVYTLTEVANTWATMEDANGDLDDAGQGRNEDDQNAANDSLVTLDKSHLSLNGIRDVADSTLKTVYADDDTVFLHVDTDLIDADANISNPANGGNSVIISDVNSVSVGIDNVNLEAWNAAAVVDSEREYREAGLDLRDVANGAYTLFDDNGSVIATVVVGEDKGTTVNYAYVISNDMSQEAYDRTNDEYTWTREVIVNGEVVELTEVGDSDPEIEDMNQGEWYEVRYDVDGYVRKVIRLSDDNALNTAAPTNDTMPAVDFDNFNTAVDGYDIIADIADVEAANDEENTVLLWDNLTDARYSITAESRSLWVDTATGAKYGFRLANDAKTVLIQDVTVRGEINWMDDVFEYTGGIDGLEDAIDDLNDNNAFVGFVGAVFENGQATSVIIYDKDPTNINTGTNTDPGDVAYSHDRMIRLHGDEDSNAESVEYNYTTDRLDYSFYVVDANGNPVAGGLDVTYDLRVVMNSGTADEEAELREDEHGTTASTGLISGDFEMAVQEGREVDIYIDNVRLPGDPDEGKVTLSLVGNLIDDGTNATDTTVWENATSTVDGEKITGNYGAVNRVEYKVAPGTVVTIVDDNLTAAGLYVLTVGTNTELVNVFAVGTGFGFNYTVTENVTLGGINASALTAVYYGDGIEIADNPAIVGEDEGVVYLNASTTLNVTVEDDAGTGFIATTDEDVVSASTSTGATAAMTGTVSVTAGTPVYIYAAAQVTPDNVNVYAEQNDGTTVQVLYQQYVAVDTPLTFDPTAGDYVVNGDVSKEDLSNGTEMPAADANFAAAHEVTLTNVEATYSGDTYTGTLYVADSETITLAPATGEGSAVLAVNPDHDVQYGQTNVTSTSVTADAAYVAAVQVKLQTVGTSLRYVDNDNREITIKSAASVGDAIFVECGAELIAVGNTTAANREISLDASTDAEVIQSLKSEGVSGSVTPARLTFTLGSKDTQLTEA